MTSTLNCSRSVSESLEQWSFSRVSGRPASAPEGKQTCRQIARSAAKANSFLPRVPQAHWSSQIEILLMEGHTEDVRGGCPAAHSQLHLFPGGGGRPQPLAVSKQAGENPPDYFTQHLKKPLGLGEIPVQTSTQLVLSSNDLKCVTGCTMWCTYNTQNCRVFTFVSDLFHEATKHKKRLDFFVWLVKIHLCCDFCEDRSKT